MRQNKLKLQQYRLDQIIKYNDPLTIIIDGNGVMNKRDDNLTIT